VERLGDLLPLLDVALRNRAGTPRDLAYLAGLDESDVARPGSTRSTELGFLSVTNDTVTYRRPDSAVAGYTEALVDRLATDVDASLRRAQSALGLIPGLLQAWMEGTTESHSLHVDMLHGPWAPADMWRLQFSRRIPEVSNVCMPSTAALFAPQQEYQAGFWADRAGSRIDVRLIMSVADATHPLARERIQLELDAGVRIRMHPAPPSFFWITDDDTIGIPLSWGEAWPTTVIGIQSPSLAAVLGWVYERLWTEAVEVDVDAGAGADQPWDPMLRLMNQGYTMEAASAALGLAPRTGRRRVADAMAHFGTSSHFSLGVAWGAAQSSSSSGL